MARLLAHGLCRTSVEVAVAGCSVDRDADLAQERDKREKA